MKIYSCYTPSHEALYRDYFLPSLPRSLESRSTSIDISGSGDYMAKDFLQTMEAKLGLMLESIAENAGAAIVWSDVDIVFTGDPTPLLTALLAQENTDIWFQKEHLGASEDVNAGLVFMRCNAAVEKLYRDALTTMRSTPDIHDQDAINQLLRNGVDVSWDYLPLQFAARSHRWPPQRDIVAYHANCTTGKDGVGQKIRQFRELERIRKYGSAYARYLRLRGKLRRSLEKTATRLKSA